MTNKITKVYKNGVAYDIYASGGAAGTGDVTGPSSSTDADIALFNGATGKIIKDSGKKLSDYQTALSTQTAYTSKGSATKVPQITTNTLGQVTGITEVTITQPTVNNATLTIQKNGTDVQTFTANQSTDATANITVNEVPGTGTTGHVLTKTADGYGWAAAAGGVQMSTITVTLTSAGWSSNSQTVSATGVTASNTVIVSPAPSSINDYASNSVYCESQGSGTLTFKCNTVPDGDISVNVLILS